MKLLTVGSSPQSNIFLNSKFVSGYHADIVLLDNGDILVCDKNSTNGTLLNGSKLSPGMEVLVKRGDSVVFADTPLNWTLVPDIKPDPDAKRLMGVGTHARNQIRISGPKVSRFHASIKQTKDGKWYICDHSTNGTTVNNVPIPKDTYVRLKKNDVIKCAGALVENPIPTTNTDVIKYIIAAAICCIFIGGGIWLLKRQTRTLSGQEIYSKYSSSTVLIMLGFHYEISAGSLDVEKTFGSKEFVVENNQLIPYDGTNGQTGFATGFYISEDGLIATNLHVAKPWLFDSTIQPVEDLVRVWLNNLSKTSNPHYVNYISQVNAKGVVDFIYAIPHGEYFDGHNAMSCVEVVASDNTEMDLAILRAMLPGHKLQPGATFIDVSTIPERGEYKPGTRVYTMGFPMALHLQDIEKKTLQAVFAEGLMMNSSNNYDFGHNAAATNGSSGSPVFNDYGQLIGVISSGFGNGYNFAVRSEYLIKLLEQAKSDNVI